MSERAEHESEPAMRRSIMPERAVGGKRIEFANNNEIIGSSGDSFSDNNQANNIASGNDESKAELTKDDGRGLTSDGPEISNSETNSQKEKDDDSTIGNLKDFDYGVICTGKGLNESAISKLSSGDLFESLDESSNEMKRNRAQEEAKTVSFNPLIKGEGGALHLEDSPNPAELTRRGMMKQMKDHNIMFESMMSILDETRKRQPRDADDVSKS